ncbi:MAG: helix-turn-helix domain-containing protein [Minwuia sp.]|uniref:helix-turn-helix domain-containing protein n=1 Tax=Minwuia sp. TaxID=2493630 RepID=UPI003A89C3B3
MGERIRRRRAELGMTQHDLAQMLDISYQQVQKYETGANRVSAGRLFAMSQRLGCNIAYFFDGLETAPPADVIEHGAANRTTIELARNFSRLPSGNVKGAISTLVRALADGDELAMEEARREMVG